MILIKNVYGLVLFLIIASISLPVFARTDVVVGNVTVNSVALLIVSDTRVRSIEVNAYADAALEHQELNVNVESLLLSNQKGEQTGLALAKVSRMMSGRHYYFQVSVQSNLGDERITADVMLPTDVDKIVNGTPLANDVITVRLTAEDASVLLKEGSAVALGMNKTLPLISDWTSGAELTFDTNNLYQALGAQHPIFDKAIVSLEVHQGNDCLGSPRKTKVFRMMPAHLEYPFITEVELTDACDPLDAYCDGQVNILDVQRVTNVLGSKAGECVYISELDVTENGVVSEDDVASVIDQFGRRYEY